MKKQFVIYINLMGDTKNLSGLTLDKEYEVLGPGNIVEPDDSYRILNDNNQTQYYFKKRFSDIIER